MKLIRSSISLAAATIVVEFKMLAQYRANLFGQIAFLPVKLVLVYLLWTVIFSNQPYEVIGGFTETTIILYFLYISLMEFMINPFCVITYELFQDIRSGKIDIFFSKPFPYLGFQYFNKFGNLLVGCIFYIVVIVVTSFVFSYSPLHVLLSILALLIGSTILFSIFAIIGTVAFKHENVLTLRDNAWNIIKLLSGVLIPIAFYPASFRGVVNILPFRFIYSFPVEILLRSLSYEYVYRYFFLSVMWMIVLLGLLWCLWARSVRHHSSQGG